MLLIAFSLEGQKMKRRVELSVLRGERYLLGLVPSIIV